MAFPRVKYGRCPVCGGMGKNDPDPGPAFSTEDHTGTGYYLIYYDGRLMCRMCKKRLSNNAETAIKTAKYNEEQEFWDKSGVRKNMAD